MYCIHVQSSLQQIVATIAAIVLATIALHVITILHGITPTHPEPHRSENSHMFCSMRTVPMDRRLPNVRDN